MTATRLKYMDDSGLLDDTATVIELRKTEDGRDCVVLDQTIFYPQGGGQPFDKGTITSGSTTFIVQETRYVDGLVFHIGKSDSGSFTQGDHVELHVDSVNRVFNCRNHTAGHLIDVAIKNIGEHLTPQKGFHFPQGAYVEYSGIIDEAQKEAILAKLQAEVTSLVQQNLPVVPSMVVKEKLHEICDFVPDWLPEGKPTRVVKIGEFSAHPCGGTHVKNTGEVKEVVVEKLKNKSGNTRVSYRISP